MYCLQDSNLEKVKSVIEMDLGGDMMTVENFLRDNGAEEMLNDPHMEQATRAISEVKKKKNYKKK